MSYLEPEFAEPYEAWKADPGPRTGTPLLHALGPTLDEIAATHVGTVDPLVRGRARRMAVQALGTYEPHRSRLKTHLYNQLQGLKRWTAQQAQPVRVPERIVFDRRRLDEASQGLSDELGRDPTDTELADRTGFSLRRLARVRSWRPSVAEGTLEATDTGLLGGVSGWNEQGSGTWLQIVMDELGPVDQLIVQHTLGLNGRRRLANQDLASQLGLSPSAVTQRKARIQRMLDREPDYSAYLG